MVYLSVASRHLPFARGGALKAETPYEPFLLIRGKYPEGGMGVNIPCYPGFPFECTLLLPCE